MKIKVISAGYIEDLELKVNNFIKDKKIIDIKFQSAIEAEESYLVVLIMYE